MQVFCPKCGTSTEVASNVTVASCSACGVALPVNLPRFGPPQAGPAPQAFGVEDMAAVPPVVPPKTAFVWRDQQLPDGSWWVMVKGRSPVASAFVAAGLLVVASSWWGTATAFTPFPLLLGVVAVIYAYRALVRAVNRITLRMDTGWVTVSRGPLPEGFSTQLVNPTPQLLRFEPVRTGRRKALNTITLLFGIQAVAVDGSVQRVPIGDTLLKGEADYACERLKMMLTETQKRTGGPPQPQQFGSVGLNAPPGF